MADRLQRSRRWFWIAGAITVLLDLLTKHWAFTALDNGTGNYGTVEFCPVLWFSGHLNRGMVWGMGQGYTLIIVVLTSLLIPAIVLMAYSCIEENAPLWSLGILFGGALGNLYDRLFWGGGVRDFLDLRNPFTGENLWPVFNVADIAILAGVVYFILWNTFVSEPLDALPEADPHDPDHDPTPDPEEEPAPADDRC